VTSSLMAYLLPFRPWFYLGHRVFVTRTTWFLSTGTTLVLSGTCHPPQRVTRLLVTKSQIRGRL
jgi:hypothetical protein